MRLKPKVWYCISFLFLVAALCMWRYADKYAAEHQRPAVSPAASKPAHPPLTKVMATNTPAEKTYRISNTKQAYTKLLRNNRALILRNALIDTALPVPLNIPEKLRAHGAPGSYLVQADRPLDKSFYAELKD